MLLLLAVAVQHQPTLVAALQAAAVVLVAIEVLLSGKQVVVAGLLNLF
jgi:hypothetical protein